MVDHMVILIVDGVFYVVTKTYLLSRINVVAKVIESKRTVKSKKAGFVR
jgi:hypothetical protein